MENTGTTVLNLVRDGKFDSCINRNNICHYACCKTEWGFIYLLPSELEAATSLGLKLTHLEIIEEFNFGGSRARCLRPCTPGDLKPIDCAIFPVWIANEEATKFLVSDNRVCPIPHNELLATMRLAQVIALQAELRTPGTLKGMVLAGKEFMGFHAFPYAIELDGQVRSLSEEEVKEIQPINKLNDHYVAEFHEVAVGLYSDVGTPDDKPISTNIRLPSPNSKTNPLQERIIWLTEIKNSGAL